MTPTKYIALVLRARRKEIGISQAEIGAMLNISRTTISMVEKGERKITFDRIQHYLAAYGLSSDCYPLFVKLLYPLDWEHLLIMKEQLGEPWEALEDKVELMINSCQFK